MRWQDEFRQFFPITRDRVYANIAYTSPLSPKVASAVADFFDGIAHARSDKPGWLADADALRARLARLIGGDARRLAFTKNTTEGLNTVAQGLPWREGDNTGRGRPGASFERAAVAEPAPAWRGRARGLVGRTSLHRGRYLGARGCAHAAGRAVLGAVRHGLAQRHRGTGPALRGRDIWLVVDGIQGAGLLRARVDDWGVDAFACGAHKGLLGPLGVGFLHLSPALLDALDPPYLGPSGGLSLDKSGPEWRVAAPDRQDARRLETGNLNYPGIAGWAGALDLIEQADPARIEPWALELSRALADGLRGLGLDVVSPADASMRSTTTALRLPDPAAALAHLAEAGVVASIVEYGYVRLSLGAYNNHEDVDRILRAARGWV